MGMIALALGLVLIVEGLVWLLAPSLFEQMLAMLRHLPLAARRQIGGLAITAGLFLLLIADRLGAL